MTTVYGYIRFVPMGDTYSFPPPYLGLVPSFVTYLEIAFKHKTDPGIYREIIACFFSLSCDVQVQGCISPYMSSNVLPEASSQKMQKKGEN